MAWVLLKGRNLDFLKKVTLFWTAKSEEKTPYASDSSTSCHTKGRRVSHFAYWLDLKSWQKSSAPGLPPHMHPCQPFKNQRHICQTLSLKTCPYNQRLK